MSEEEAKSKIAKVADERFHWLWTLSVPDIPPCLRKTEAEAKIGAAYLDFGEQAPVGNCRLPSHKAWVRDCYHELNQIAWKTFASSERGFAVSGTPGTGKTIFGVLFLIDLVRAMRSAFEKKEPLPFGLNGVIIYEAGSIRGSMSYKIDVEAKTVEFCQFPQMVVTKNAFWIKDGDCSVSDVPCRLLLTSSPKENGKEALKIFRFIHFMRMWQTSELIECFRAIGGPSDDRAAYGDEVLPLYDDVKENLEFGDDFQEKLWRRLSKELGHVPRRLFQPETNLAIRNAALSTLTQEELTNLLKLVSSEMTAAVSYTRGFPHSLLSMYVSPSMRSYQFIPATKLIAKLIAKKSLENELQVACSLMGRQTGSCLGKAFEPYAIYLLRIPNKYIIRNLATSVTAELVLAGFHSEHEVENKAIPTLTLAPNVIYTPKDPNFPCIDAWTSEDMFQVKSSTATAAKTGAPRFLHVRSKVTNNRIIYIVPAPHGEDFKYVEQTVPGTVDEWVMEIPMSRS